jgi:hypothetical protein
LLEEAEILLTGIKRRTDEEEKWIAERRSAT